MLLPLLETCTQQECSVFAGPTFLFTARAVSCCLHSYSLAFVKVMFEAFFFQVYFLALLSLFDRVVESDRKWGDRGNEMQRRATR